MGYWESCSTGNKTAGQCEAFQPGGSFFWRELFQEVSGAGVSSWLGADVKVSFCFISSLWLQSRSLLSMCLWPF